MRRTIRGIDLPMKFYLHHVPGRLRVRIPNLRNNAEMSAQVKKLLCINGTRQVSVRPLTGSVTVTYDPAVIGAADLLGLLKDNGLFQEDRVVTLDSQLRRATDNAARKVSRAAFGWAVGRVLEANGLSLIAAFI
jgi:hypothetical protein